MDNKNEDGLDLQPWSERMPIPLKQEEQSIACGPKQVLQDASHVWHPPDFPGMKTGYRLDIMQQQNVTFKRTQSDINCCLNWPYFTPTGAYI